MDKYFQIIGFDLLQASLSRSHDKLDWYFNHLVSMIAFRNKYISLLLATIVASFVLNIASYIFFGSCHVKKSYSAKTLQAC
jgi:hypothetical protein